MAQKSNAPTAIACGLSVGTSVLTLMTDSCAKRIQNKVPDLLKAADAGVSGHDSSDSHL